MSPDPASSRRRPYLERLDAAARTRLLTLGTALRIPRHERLMSMGDRGEHVMLVIGGVVKVVSEDASGAAVILDLGMPGDVLGEAAVLDEGVRMASVVAVSPVEVRRIAASEFHQFLDDHPGATKELLITVLRRFHIAQQQRSLTQNPLTVSRVARRLNYLLDICGRETADGWIIDAPISRDELAQFVPTGRTSLITMLTELSRQGVVRRSRMRIIVVDRSRLIALADDHSAV